MKNMVSLFFSDLKNCPGEIFDKTRVIYTGYNEKEKLMSLQSVLNRIRNEKTEELVSEVVTSVVTGVAVIIVGTLIAKAVDGIINKSEDEIKEI